MPSILVPLRVRLLRLVGTLRTSIKGVILGTSILAIGSIDWTWKLRRQVSQVSHHASSLRTTLRRSLPVEQDRIPHRHHHQSSLFQRLHAFRDNRHLRFLFTNFQNFNDSHQDLCGRLHQHRPKIYTTRRKSSGAILPRKRHPPISNPLDMELRLLPNSRSPSVRPNACLLGRTSGQHHLHLRRHIRPRHIHHTHSHRALATLSHRPHRLDNFQRRGNHNVRRNGAACGIDTSAWRLGYKECGSAICNWV